MKRKKNIHFGFAPSRPTRADLVKSRREFKLAVRQKTKALRAEYKRLRKSARSGRTASTRKLEQLFHEVYGPQENPRLAAMKGSIDMAQKKRKSKKKKSARKGTMPAGLKAYWAKKRRAKPKRRNPGKKRPRAKPSKKRAAGRKRRSGLMAGMYDRRLAEVIRELKRKNPRRRRKSRKSNPRHTAKRITLKGFTRSQIQTVANVVRRATGKRVRIVKP